MELDGNLFSGSLLFWLTGLVVVTSLTALRLAPWKRLTQQNQTHVFFGAVVALIVLWHMRGQIQPGLSFHLLGVTVITLMFGWSMAIIIASLALFAVSLNTGYGWEGYVVSFLTVALVPITLSQISLVLVRSWLPKQFFVYVLGNGFFTGWLVGYISGYLAMLLLVLSGAYTMAELQVTVMPSLSAKEG
ncbi:MAG: energy-coupling factor ABC transporter permease [Candidatus Thiodiazotropha sp. L084R]